MRRHGLSIAFAAFAASLLLGCVGASDVVRVGPDPTPGTGFRYVLNINGAFDGQGLSGMIDPATGREIALTTLIRGQGKGIITIRASIPIVTIDGDVNFIVEPVPGREAEAVAAHVKGELLILRGGVPGALNAPGTMAALNAMPIPQDAPREPTIIITPPNIPPPPPPPPAFPDPQPEAGGPPGNSCGGAAKGCGSGGTSKTSSTYFTPPAGK